MTKLLSFVVGLTLYSAVGIGYGRYLNLTRWTDEDGVFKSYLAGLLWPYVVPAMIAVWFAEICASIVNDGWWKDRT